jgi:hypothetical protein
MLEFADLANVGMLDSMSVRGGRWSSRSNQRVLLLLAGELVNSGGAQAWASRCRSIQPHG